MYGLLLQAALEFLSTKFGNDVAREILSIVDGHSGDAGGGVTRSVRAGFAVHQLYSDKMLAKLTKATSEVTDIPPESLMEQLGTFFVRFTRQSGYDSLLRLVGRNLRNFIMGLDNLHEYFKVTYPKIKPPSFLVLQESEENMIICYRSPRGGLEGYVVGQLKEVAKAYFNIQLEISIISSEEDNRGFWTTNMALEFDNSDLAERSYVKSINELEGQMTTPQMLMESQPFYIAFNKDLEILSIGKSLAIAMPTIVGEDLNETFEIIQPLVPMLWDNFIEYVNNVFVLQSLKAIERKDDHDEDSKLIPIRLRGQMYFFEEIDCIIFMAMPMVESVPQLMQLGLKVHELSMADTTRDLLTYKHNRTAGKDPLLVNVI